MTSSEIGLAGKASPCKRTSNGRKRFRKAWDRNRIPENKSQRDGRKARGAQQRVQAKKDNRRDHRVSFRRLFLGDQSLDQVKKLRSVSEGTTKYEAGAPHPARLIMRITPDRNWIGKQALGECL